MPCTSRFHIIAKNLPLEENLIELSAWVSGEKASEGRSEPVGDSAHRHGIRVDGKLRAEAVAKIRYVATKVG